MQEVKTCTSVLSVSCRKSGWTVDGVILIVTWAEMWFGGKKLWDEQMVS